MSNVEDLKRRVDPKLDEYATRINNEHAAIASAYKDAKAANHNIVKRAITAGDLLNLVKSGMEHGDWLQWLQTKCPDIKERTAQRYMKLAANKEKLNNKIKSDTMSDFADDEVAPDFTLASAFKLINDSGGGDGNPNIAYERAEKALINKLNKLDLSTAEASVSNTVEALNGELTKLKAAAFEKAKKAKAA